MTERRKNFPVKELPEGPAEERGEDVATLEAPPRLRCPPLYQVILLNDDYTPMAFVVSVLESFFGKDRHSAVRIMLEVHNSGRGSCGIFSHDVAETKVAEVNRYSRQSRHPLLCIMEQA